MSQAKPIPRPAPLRPAARPQQNFDSSVRLKSQPPVAMPSEATGLALVRPRPAPPQAPPVTAKRPPPPLPLSARPSPPPLPSAGPPARVAPALVPPPLVAAPIVAPPILTAPNVASPVLSPLPRLDAPKAATRQPPLGVMAEPVVTQFRAAPPAPTAATPLLRDEELPDVLDGTARRRRMALLFAALALLAVGGTAAAAISSHF